MILVGGPLCGTSVPHTWFGHGCYTVEYRDGVHYTYRATGAKNKLGAYVAQVQRPAHADT